MTEQERDIIARAPFSYALTGETAEQDARVRAMERGGLVLRTVTEAPGYGEFAQVRVLATLRGAETFLASAPR